MCCAFRSFHRSLLYMYCYYRYVPLDTYVYSIYTTTLYACVPVYILHIAYLTDIYRAYSQ